MGEERGTALLRPAKEEPRALLGRLRLSEERRSGVAQEATPCRGRPKKSAAGVAEQPARGLLSTGAEAAAPKHKAGALLAAEEGRWLCSGGAATEEARGAGWGTTKE
jgi:hypothetical protein